MNDQSKLMVELLTEIRDKLELGASASASLRGPVADPGPDWGRWPGRWADPAPPWWTRGPVADPIPPWGRVSSAALSPELAARRYEGPERIPNIAGPVADPGPELLLDKARLAKLKVVKLEQVLLGLEKQMEAIQLERDLLKEEYKIK